MAELIAPESRLLDHPGTAPDPGTATDLGTADQSRRQVLYWRLLSQLFGTEDEVALETASVGIVEQEGLPAALLDPRTSLDNLVQRHPHLGEQLTGLLAEDTTHPAGAEVARAALASKLLLNVFGTGHGPVSAAQLSTWQADAGWFERSLGAEPGELRARGSQDGPGTVLAGIEGDLVSRMQLREVLANPTLAAQLTPSPSLIDQLLRDKGNLDGVALANAKRLIRRYVDDLAAVLRTQVAQATVGEIDRSIPPKRVFRNLDIDRTLWKNLPNYNPEDGLLYVDRLFYRQTARKQTPSRLIVVVDQSGSMVDAMVNCTILASIFAALPKVDVNLIAFDTQALDLTPWVQDPFEVLLRTKLGGGNDGPVAMAMAMPMITDPRNTVMVWISDFYEFGRSQPLYDGIEAVHRSGVKFIPVGSVGSGGHQSVDPWFKKRFAELGTPVISGKIDKLVVELKNFLT